VIESNASRVDNGPAVMRNLVICPARQRIELD
jgi:hypothetical protein